MIVVSDASPITNLIEIGLLHLLNRLFDEVIIPETVAREITFLAEHLRQ